MLSYVLTREMWAESSTSVWWEFSTLSVYLARKSHVTALTSLSRIQGEGAAKADIISYTTEHKNGGYEVISPYTPLYESERDVFGNLVVREWWIAEGISRLAIDNCVDVTFRLGAGPRTFAHAVCSAFVREYKVKILPVITLEKWVKNLIGWFSGEPGKLEKVDGSDEAFRTHVVFDRATGDIVHVHHSMAASGARALEESQLEAGALRFAGELTGRRIDELDTISVRDVDLGQRRRLKVDVTSRQITDVDES